LAGGLSPDALEKLKCSPDPLAAIWGLLLREGEEEGRGGKEVRRGEENRRKGRGRERRDRGGWE